MHKVTKVSFIGRSFTAIERYKTGRKNVKVVDGHITVISCGPNSLHNELGGDKKVHYFPEGTSRLKVIKAIAEMGIDPAILHDMDNW